MNKIPALRKCAKIALRQAIKNHEKQSIVIDWLEDKGFDPLPLSEFSLVVSNWAIFGCADRASVFCACKGLAEYEYLLQHIQEVFHVCPDYKATESFIDLAVDVGHISCDVAGGKGIDVNISIRIAARGSNAAETILNDTCHLVEREKWHPPTEGFTSKYLELVCKEADNDNDS